MLALSLSASPNNAVNELIKALDDPNVYIRTASVHALGSISVPAAMPKLAKMLHGDGPALEGGYNQSAILNAITNLGSPEATGVVAEHLAACLKKADMGMTVYGALFAFEKLAGQ